MNRRLFLKRCSAIGALLFIKPMVVAEAITPKTKFFTFQSEELYFPVEYFNIEIIKPAAQKIADQIDKEMINLGRGTIYITLMREKNECKTGSKKNEKRTTS